MNDLGVWQCEPDEADTIEVARKLVSHMGNTRGALRQPRRIGLTKLPEVRRSKFADKVGHGRREFSLVRENANGDLKIEDFAGACDGRMIGDDLFAKRRAGARHAENKDRQGGLASIVQVRRNELFGENRLNTLLE